MGEMLPQRLGAVVWVLLRAGPSTVCFQRALKKIVW